jgi:hypothetical protein
VFTVTGAVTLVREEADQDLHIVLRQGRSQMIVEAPNAPVCTPKAVTYRKRQMAAARRAVLSSGGGCARALVTGVAFFDFIHGQTGLAPNGIELHPVLGFRCLSGASRSALSMGPEGTSGDSPTFIVNKRVGDVTMGTAAPDS